MKSIRYIVTILVFLGLGVLVGAYIPNSGSGGGLVSSYSKVREILTRIDNDYVDSVDMEELTDYAIEKLLEKLDPHSVYIPPKEVELAQSQLRGNFEGVGIEFNILRDTLLVVTPLSGGPSEKVGIRAGDRIIKVDTMMFAGIGIKNSDVFEALRGDKGTEVNLSIKRRGKKDLLQFTVVRDKIPTNAVDVSYMIDDKVGYLKINRFSATVYDEFKEHLKSLKDDGMKSLILDLRDNPGGYLDKAVRIADEFLPGRDTLVFTKGKNTRYNDVLRSGQTGIFEKGALMVLVNEGSASASEIVAGALQDYDRALILGRRSFGKGLVQQPIPLTNSGELRLTISRYYIPSGRSIQKSYEDGVEAYQDDYLNRIQHGELFNEDSIKFPDSLMYSTRAGRKVYGGGGIMPDIFVPRDTSDWTELVNSLYSTNIIREFSYDFVDDSRTDLETMGYEAYKNNFEISEDMMKTMLANLEETGTEVKTDELEKSRSFIKLQLKALIARNVWGSDGFFPIYHQRDEVVQAAIKNLDQAIAFAQKKY